MARRKLLFVLIFSITSILVAAQEQCPGENEYLDVVLGVCLPCQTGLVLNIEKTGCVCEEKDKFYDKDLENCMPCQKGKVINEDQTGCQLGDQCEKKDYYFDSFVGSCLPCQKGEVLNEDRTGCVMPTTNQEVPDETADEDVDYSDRSSCPLEDSCETEIIMVGNSCTCKKIENCQATASDFEIRGVSSDTNSGQFCGITCDRFKDKGYRCVEQHLCNTKDCTIIQDGSGIIDVFTNDDKKKKEKRCCDRPPVSVDLANSLCPPFQSCCRLDEEEATSDDYDIKGVSEDLEEEQKLCRPTTNSNRECEDVVCTKDVDASKNYNECGRIITSFKDRVYDSETASNLLKNFTAQPGEYPHVCALFVQNRRSSPYIGGASLIADNLILTAAHKILLKDTDYTNTGNLFVRCGAFDLQGDYPFLPPQSRRVSKVHIDPDYNQNKLRDNLAILQVEEKFDFQEHISPVCLPTKPDQLFLGDECWSAGWGADSFEQGALYSKLLKKVKLDVIDSAACEKTINSEVDRFATTKKTFYVHESRICAQGKPDEDTCKGDGGSPLFCKINNKWVQSGVVAFGFGCGNNWPGIYSSVSHGLCWIDRIMSCANSSKTSEKSKLNLTADQCAAWQQKNQNLNTEECLVDYS